MIVIEEDESGTNLLEYSTIIRNEAVQEHLGYSTMSVDFRMTLLQVYTKSEGSFRKVDSGANTRLQTSVESHSSDKSHINRPMSLAITGSTNLRDARTNLDQQSAKSS